MLEQFLAEPRILVSVSMLLIASIMDLKNREVHDVVWIVFGSIGVLIHVFDPSLFENALPLIFASSFSVVVAYAAYRIGLFASADALALVALAVIIPIYSGPNMLHNIAPLTVLTNAAILASLFLLVNVVRNGIALIKGVELFEGFDESPWRKTMAFLIGYKAERPQFAYSIEMESVGRKKFDFSLVRPESEEYCAKPGSWVMAGLPFIVYMLAGFVVMVLLGDIMMSMLSLLF